MGAMAACAPATDCAIRETGGLSTVSGGWSCVQQPDVEHRFPRGVGATKTNASAVGGVGSLGQTNVQKGSEAWDDSTSFCDRRVALRDAPHSNDRCGSKREELNVSKSGPLGFNKPTLTRRVATSLVGQQKTRRGRDAHY
jgi:hypothetical protein